jgi:hypothetical protein
MLTLCHAFYLRVCLQLPERVQQLSATATQILFDFDSINGYQFGPLRQAVQAAAARGKAVPLKPLMHRWVQTRVGKQCMLIQQQGHNLGFGMSQGRLLCRDVECCETAIAVSTGNVEAHGTSADAAALTAAWAVDAGCAGSSLPVSCR